MRNNVMIGAIKPYKKSKAASRVLRLMDEDYSYQEALRIALRENKGVGKRSLEKELDRYI
jgi:DNA-directed RNA polymerase subunit L